LPPPPSASPRCTSSSPPAPEWRSMASRGPPHRCRGEWKWHTARATLLSGTANLRAATSPSLRPPLTPHSLSSARLLTTSLTLATRPTTSILGPSPPLPR
jgi:hypothetical protein